MAILRLFGRILYNIILPIALIFLVASIGIWYLTMAKLMTPTQAAIVEPKDAQEIFKDVLDIVFTLGAVIIALVGVGLYRLLSQQIQEQVYRSVETRFMLTLIKHRAEIGSAFWELYEEAIKIREMDLARKWLDLALWQTETAHTEVIWLRSKLRWGRRSRDVDVEDLAMRTCSIKNNLAYYLSEKAIQVGASEDEKHRAVRLAKYVDQNWIDFPERAASFRDTVAKVRERIPDYS